jgi:hypothetical protein
MATDLKTRLDLLYGRYGSASLDTDPIDPPIEQKEGDRTLRS